MATAFAANGMIGAINASRSVAGRRNSSRMFCSASYSSSVMDPYKTLRIQPGATESEVRKAFRKLALQYHPDVCKGNNCGVQFSQINEAYGAVMSRLRQGGEEEEEEASVEEYASNQTQETPERDEDERIYDPDYDQWEEWIGFEGAGKWDYASHASPYIYI
ncbi:Chaperone protein dnaJ 8, chloroplastic [Linum perenne]